ncbi:MAG: UDP-N-acetylmuramate dehydrogenase [Mediterranea sp.]|jgi:UDP-N-acetylmuramate dehydrogenase|nr:UDP-N-acetylmuramate dehydrogenase [Mediterranea sp.]
MYSLLPHNTFGIDVNAARFVEYASIDALKAFIARGELTAPYLHIGAGSNLLFTKDYEGLVLHSRIEGIEVVEEDERWVTLRVGAGVVWDDFVLHCVRHGRYGVENLSLIPGEVGASAVQNIGAYGVEAKDLITLVETVDVWGEERAYRVDECQYRYRDSRFKRAENKGVFVTYVHFRLGKLPVFHLEYGAVRQQLADCHEPTLSTVRQAIVDIRRQKLPDPAEWGNAGSFFMNPVVSGERFETLRQAYPDMPHYDLGDGSVKIPAGWLIERCGWKGRVLGPAAVYHRQALVLINLGGAKGSDIVALSDAVRASVRDAFGIDIRPEVNMI